MNNYDKIIDAIKDIKPSCKPKTDHKSLAKTIDYYITMNKLQQIKDGKYVQAWVAVQLYPKDSRQVAKSRFHNKLFNNQGRRFTEAEISQIENILK